MSPQIPFYSEEHIETRDMLVGQFTRHLKGALEQVNNAFRLIRIETPTVKEETTGTMRDYLRSEFAPSTVTSVADILNSNIVKYRLPLVLWEYGKVYKPTERTHLGYHTFFSRTTATDYLSIIQAIAQKMLAFADPPPITSLQERTDLWADGRHIEFIIDMDACAETHLENVKNGRITSIRPGPSGN